MVRCTRMWRRPAYLFQNTITLFRMRTWPGSQWFLKKRETEINWVVISKVSNPMVIPWQFQGYNHTRGRLCQWDRCYPWKSFLLFLGSIWAFYVTKWWQIKDDSICNFHEHLNWVMYYKKYAWKRIPVLKVYTYIIKYMHISFLIQKQVHLMDCTDEAASWHCRYLLSLEKMLFESY